MDPKVEASQIPGRELAMDASSSIACRAKLWLLIALITLIGAACTPGGKAAQPSAPPAPASTGVTEKGPVTLTVWDQEAGPVSRVWDRLNTEVEHKYPNVTIKPLNRVYGQLKTLLNLPIPHPHPHAATEPSHPSPHYRPPLT